LIHNTSTKPIAVATANTTLTKANGDNIKTMTKNISELQERNKELEEENVRLKAQINNTVVPINKMDEFKNFALE